MSESQSTSQSTSASGLTKNCRIYIKKILERASQISKQKSFVNANKIKRQSMFLFSIIPNLKSTNLGGILSSKGYYNERLSVEIGPDPTWPDPTRAVNKRLTHLWPGHLLILSEGEKLKNLGFLGGDFPNPDPSQRWLTRPNTDQKFLTWSHPLLSGVLTFFDSSCKCEMQKNCVFNGKSKLVKTWPDDWTFMSKFYFNSQLNEVIPEL